MYKNGDKCPLCDTGELAGKVVDETFEYKGEYLTVPDYVVYGCSECEEEIVDRDTLKSSSKLIKDFYRKVDGLLTSEDIKALRKKLGLTQEEMANILGGGKKAFARYERGQVIQSRGMDNLLRILDKYPYVLDALEGKYEEDFKGEVISILDYRERLEYAKDEAYTRTTLADQDALYG